MVSDHVMKNSFVTIIITKSNDVDNWVDDHEKDNDGEDEKDGNSFETIIMTKSNDVENWAENHEKDNDGDDKKDGKSEKVAQQKCE